MASAVDKHWRRSGPGRWVWPLLSLAMIGAIAAGRRMSEATPEQALAYGEKIRHTLTAIPYSVGDWLGTDVHVAGSRMLNANAVFSRRYRQIEGKSAVTVIFVHCLDSRDLLGHYPPHCYPAQGWTKTNQRDARVERGSLVCQFTEYEFIRQDVLEKQHMAVISFFLLPDGRITPHMRDVNRISQDNRWKQYGAGQVQIVLSARLSTDERAELARFVMDLMQPTINLVLTGARHEFE